MNRRQRKAPTGRAMLAGLVLFAASRGSAQITTDVIGMHDLSSGSTSPVAGARPGSCTYCHAPHSGLASGRALWNQQLSKMVYNPYTSPTYVAKGEKGQQPVVGSDTSLCLSCHDGTVAVGNTIVSGQILTMGQMNPSDQFLPNTPNLLASHPQDLTTIQDAPDLYANLAAKGQTNDPAGAVQLINGNVECTSCHNPHVQAKDPLAQNFLVKDSSQGSLCLSCHDPTRQMQGQTNPLAGWSASVHATGNDTVQNLPYTTLSLNACLNCHQDHNAPGTDWVLRGAGDQDCLNCHSSTAAANIPTSNRMMNGGAQPALAGPVKMLARLNVGSEYAKISHPLMLEVTSMQAQRTGFSRNPALPAPDDPSLSGCISCHDPHAVTSSATTTTAVAPVVRPSLAGVAGVSENGVTAVRPALYEYQICLRCHGAKAKRAQDESKYGYTPLRLVSGSAPMNLIPQFGSTAASSHPVFHPRNSSLPQPSLLQNMVSLDGITPSRTMGTQIYCTDCHNSDDNREFGSNGPNGPHGSKWSHILERRYEYSQAPLPGQPVNNLFPNPDLSSNGPYALCAKCHNLANILQNASFSQHAQHIRAGFSCSACHTAHGVGASSGNSSGQRLISFDLSVVAPNSGSTPSYNKGTGTCTLTCHNTVHNMDGSITARGGVPGKR